MVKRGEMDTPSPPFRGEREGARRAATGRVRWVLRGRPGFPPPPPAPSPPPPDGGLPPRLFPPTARSPPPALPAGPPPPGAATPRRVPLAISGDVDADPADRSSRVRLGVMDRALPDAAREAHGELARRAGGAEQQVGDRVSRLAATEPCMQDRIGMPVLPFQGQRSAATAAA